jgi:uncharacterized protein
MKLLRNEKTILTNIKIADGFFDRLRGLMFKRELGEEEGLFMPNCNWVHTLFMRFSLDIVYLNKNNKICHIDVDVKPWRFCLPVFSAKSIIELNSGVAERLSLQEGDLLKCTN